MKRRVWLWALLLAVAAAAAVAVFALRRAPEAEEASQALLTAAEGLDEILISARLDPQTRTLEVEQTLTLRNPTGLSQEACVLRAWPNAFRSLDTSPCASEELYDLCYPDGFSLGALVMEQALADGEASAYRYLDEAQTVLSVPVAGGWAANETITLTLRYTVYVPAAAYRFGVWEGVWALGSAFAVPAKWEDGAWRTDEYLPIGDPFLSDCANYDVTLTVPEGCQVAGPAPHEAETLDGWTSWKFRCLAVREAAFTVYEKASVAQGVTDGVLVSAYAANASRAREMLEDGLHALAFYAQRYGAYPYQTLSLCEVSFPLGGMEYPCLVMLSADSAGGEALEYETAHEVAHQWWGVVVGSDPWYQAWQDEALCEFSLLEYIGERYGQARREEMEQSRVYSALRVTVPRGVTPGAPLDVFSNLSQYTLVVYNRGAALLLALDDMLGEGLNRFLRAYYETYAFGYATREDFEALLAQTTGEDPGPLMLDYLDTYILN